MLLFASSNLFFLLAYFSSQAIAPDTTSNPTLAMWWEVDGGDGKLIQSKDLAELAAMEKTTLRCYDDIRKEWLGWVKLQRHVETRKGHHYASYTAEEVLITPSNGPGAHSAEEIMRSLALEAYQTLASANEKVRFQGVWASDSLAWFQSYLGLGRLSFKWRVGTGMKKVEGESDLALMREMGIYQLHVFESLLQGNKRQSFMVFSVTFTIQQEGAYYAFKTTSVSPTPHEQGCSEETLFKEAALEACHILRSVVSPEHFLGISSSQLAFKEGLLAATPICFGGSAADGGSCLRKPKTTITIQSLLSSDPPQY